MPPLGFSVYLVCLLGVAGVVVFSGLRNQRRVFRANRIEFQKMVARQELQKARDEEEKAWGHGI